MYCLQWGRVGHRSQDCKFDRSSSLNFDVWMTNSDELNHSSINVDPTTTMANDDIPTPIARIHHRWRGLPRRQLSMANQRNDESRRQAPVSPLQTSDARDPSRESVSKSRPVSSIPWWSWVKSTATTPSGATSFSRDLGTQRIFPNSNFFTDQGPCCRGDLEISDRAFGLLGTLSDSDPSDGEVELFGFAMILDNSTRDPVFMINEVGSDAISKNQTRLDSFIKEGLQRYLKFKIQLQYN